MNAREAAVDTSAGLGRAQWPGCILMSALAGVEMNRPSAARKWELISEGEDVMAPGKPIQLRGHPHIMACLTTMSFGL